jgi:hypothetical protein
MKTCLLLCVCALVAFIVVPFVSAKISDDQIKSAGAIELTTELVDKMEKAAAAIHADEAARTELAAIKETEVDAMAAAMESKCPKTAAHLKAAGITAAELMKGASAMLACFMDEQGELANSDNETAKANAEFVKENKERCDKVGGAVMAMQMAPGESLDSAKKP